MKSFKTKVYLHKEKEDNWDLEEKCEKKKYENTRNILYLGYEVTFEIEIFEDCSNKVLKINGIDVSDKDISI